MTYEIYWEKKLNSHLFFVQTNGVFSSTPFLLIKKKDFIYRTEMILYLILVKIKAINEENTNDALRKWQNDNIICNRFIEKNATIQIR